MDRLQQEIDQFIEGLADRQPRQITWRDKFPTNRQRTVLVDSGYRVPPTRGAAFDLIATFQDWEDRK